MKFLGVPIGTASFCNDVTARRAAKAQKTLDALSSLDNCQLALYLLRHCCSFGKLAFSLRNTAPRAHEAALEEFDKSVRHCFENFSGLHPDESEWNQAGLATRKGGLGLRSTLRHSRPAYLASRSTCQRKCIELDHNHSWEINDPTSAVAEATAWFNATVEADCQVPHDVADALPQSQLSAALDSAMLTALQSSPDCTLRRKGHLILLQQHGAGAWLQAQPAKAFGNDFNDALFIVALRRRLGMKVRSRPVFCPFCDCVSDEFGDHDICCAGGGDRTKRHHRLRNKGQAFCLSAGLNSELEKPNLLAPRPSEGSRAEDGASIDNARRASSRRPADVYVPNWFLGGPAALDFAVTNGIRNTMLRASVNDAEAAACAYENYKRSFLNTAEQCRQEGLEFVPVVMEGCSGAWGPAARKVWSHIAKLVASKTGEDSSKVSERHQQSLSICVQRENARAIARRQGLPSWEQSILGMP